MLGGVEACRGTAFAVDGVVYLHANGGVKLTVYADMVVGASAVDFCAAVQVDVVIGELRHGGFDAVQARLEGEDLVIKQDAPGDVFGVDEVAVDILGVDVEVYAAPSCVDLPVEQLGRGGRGGSAGLLRPAFGCAFSY